VRARGTGRTRPRVNQGWASGDHAGSRVPRRELEGSVSSITPLVEPGRLEPSGTRNQTDSDVVQVMAQIARGTTCRISSTRLTAAPPEKPVIPVASRPTREAPLQELFNGKNRRYVGFRKYFGDAAASRVRLQGLTISHCQANLLRNKTPETCMKIKGQGKSRRATVVVAGTSLTLLVVMSMLSVAGARDLSFPTFNPGKSFTGVKMQQGRPQLDNDAKGDFGRSMKSAGPRGVGMQQGKILRDNDGIDAEKRGTKSIFFCGANCGK
jgi:hypothetical protein